MRPSLAVAKSPGISGMEVKLATSLATTDCRSFRGALQYAAYRLLRKTVVSLPGILSANSASRYSRFRTPAASKARIIVSANARCDGLPGRILSSKFTVYFSGASLTDLLTRPPPETQRPGTHPGPKKPPPHAVACGHRDILVHPFPARAWLCLPIPPRAPAGARESMAARESKCAPWLWCWRWLRPRRAGQPRSVPPLV